jgi:hypothetical protein
VSGLTSPTRNIASGPPRITLTVPAKNNVSAFGPSRAIAGISIARVRRMSVAGSRKRLATK